MSYAYQEDWVHIDEHLDQIDKLKAQIESLELEVKWTNDDEVYLLARLYKALKTASQNNEWQSYMSLRDAFGAYPDEKKQSAIKKIEAGEA